MNQKLTFRLLAFAFTFSTSFTLGFSAVRLWLGGTNTNWTTNSNWSGGNKPGSADDVILTASGTYRPITNISGTIRSLTLNSCNITLTGSLTISNSVNFFDGIIRTTAVNLLIINASATVNGANDTSHVFGPVRKIGNAYGSFTFPTGNGFIYAPIRVSSVAGGVNSDYFEAQYFHSTAPYSLTSKDASLSNISRVEYWDLFSNDLRAVVTLSYRIPRSGGISNISQLRVARWDGGGWRNHGGNVSGSPSSGTVATTSTLLVFGPFTLSTTNSINALPVELINFSAHAKGNKSVLKWSTASEVNLNRFEICRSTDGQNYFPIGTVNANTGSNDLTDYSFTDENPGKAKGTLVYYRLKMVENSGTFNLSHISHIRFSDLSDNTILNIYPNPTTEFINIKSEDIKESYIDLTISDINGKTVMASTINEMHSGDVMSIDVRSLDNGVYFANLTGIDGKPVSVKFIKR